MTKLFILIPLFASAFTVSAQAQDASVAVGFSDLDLTSESGVARLDHRINSAIATVCDDELGQKSLSKFMAVRKCAKETRADVSGPRQIAIARARGQVPSVELASAGGADTLTVRRR